MYQGTINEREPGDFPFSSCRVGLEYHSKKEMFFKKKKINNNTIRLFSKFNLH
jgi:hypothetical protein